MKPTTLRYLQTAIFTLICSFAFAQRADYKYVKPIPQTQEGWNKFNIGNEINSKVNSNFSDIRIYEITTEDTVEIAYILNRESTTSAPEFVPTTLKNITIWHNNKASFIAELTKPIQINEIQLTFQEKNFDAKAEILGSQDMKNWELLATEQRIVGIQNASTDFSFTTLYFANAQYKYYKCNIESSKPLNISKVAVYDELPNRFINNLKDTFSTTQIHATQDKKQRLTTYFVQFEQGVYADALRLTLDSAHEFTRKISLYNILDSVESEKGWIYTEQLITTASIASFANNTLKFAPTLLGKLKIIIHNGDNPNLTITSVTATAPIYSIYTKLKNNNSNYFLYFGNPNANNPDYDIIHFIDQIPENVHLIKLGATMLLHPAPTIEEEQPISFLSDPTTLWTLLIIMVVVIGWFSIKMLLKKEVE